MVDVVRQRRHAICVHSACVVDGLFWSIALGICIQPYRERVGFAVSFCILGYGIDS